MSVFDAHIDLSPVNQNHIEQLLLDRVKHACYAALKNPDMIHVMQMEVHKIGIELP
jgi:hypothetical protein